MEKVELEQMDWEELSEAGKRMVRQAKRDLIVGETYMLMAEAKIHELELKNKKKIGDMKDGE